MKAATRLPIIWVLPLTLAGCYEPASTWDNKRGRYVSTSESKQDRHRELREIERRLDQLETKER